MQVESTLQYHDFEVILTGDLKEPEPLEIGASQQQQKEHETALKKYKKANGFAVTFLTTTIEEKPLQLILMFRAAKRYVGQAIDCLRTEVRAEVGKPLLAATELQER